MTERLSDPPPVRWSLRQRVAEELKTLRRERWLSVTGAEVAFTAGKLAGLRRVAAWLNKEGMS